MLAPLTETNNLPLQTATFEAECEHLSQSCVKPIQSPFPYSTMLQSPARYPPLTVCAAADVAPPMVLAPCSTDLVGCACSILTNAPAVPPRKFAHASAGAHCLTHSLQPTHLLLPRRQWQRRLCSAGCLRLLLVCWGPQPHRPAPAATAAALSLRTRCSRQPQRTATAASSAARPGKPTAPECTACLQNGCYQVPNANAMFDLCHGCINLSVAQGWYGRHLWLRLACISSSTGAPSICMFQEKWVCPKMCTSGRRAANRAASGSDPMRHATC